MNIGLVIKNARKAKGLTQEELGKIIGVQKSAIAKYESNRVQNIKRSTLQKLANALDLRGSDLIGSVEEDDANCPAVPIYNALNSKGKKEFIRYGHYLTDQEEFSNVISIKYIRHFLTPAAAGYLNPIEGSDYELIPRNEKTPSTADYCVTIEGDSMYPYLEDGQIVYVQADAEVREIIDIGIWVLDGEVFCKQWCLGEDGAMHLLSANPKRKDANKVIEADSDHQLTRLGKVLIDVKLPKPVYEE